MCVPRCESRSGDPYSVTGGGFLSGAQQQAPSELPRTHAVNRQGPNVMTTQGQATYGSVLVSGSTRRRVRMS